MILNLDSQDFISTSVPPEINRKFQLRFTAATQTVFNFLNHQKPLRPELPCWDPHSVTSMPFPAPVELVPVELMPLWTLVMRLLLTPRLASVALRSECTPPAFSPPAHQICPQDDLQIRVISGNVHSLHLQLPPQRAPPHSRNQKPIAHPWCCQTTLASWQQQTSEQTRTALTLAPTETSWDNTTKQVRKWQP
jgi:hypothetical protein